MLVLERRTHYQPCDVKSVSLARDNPIETWDHTFKQVAVRLQQAHIQDLANSTAVPPRHYVLNPRTLTFPPQSLRAALHSTTTIVPGAVVGPETLTGSSRMKGGSATKFLLETIFARALAEVGNVDLIPSPAPDAPMFAKPVTAEGLLQAFEITYRSVLFLVSSSHLVLCTAHSLRAVLHCRGAYNSLENVTPLMVAAGESLKQGGHVYYLSTGSIAVLTTIDASGTPASLHSRCSCAFADKTPRIRAECPPTFGSKFTDVQAFVHNGWKNMGTPSRPRHTVMPHCILSSHTHTHTLISLLVAHRQQGRRSDQRERKVPPLVGRL
jgi:hypothetical protein